MLEGGVWYQVRQVAGALLVRDEHGEPVVCPMLEPASHYYGVMTRSPWMPVLVGERS